MYLVLMVPDLTSLPVEDIVIKYSASAFIASFVMYGLVYCWFTFLAFRFLDKFNFQLDRLRVHLTLKSTIGEDASVLGCLFICYLKSPSNITYRANLYYGEQICHFLLCVPFILLAGWGWCMVVFVEPRSLGLLVAWAGPGTMCLIYAGTAWKRLAWRMTSLIMLAVYIGLLFFVVFLVSIIFFDPGVSLYGHPLDFTALSLLFGTLNCAPLLLLVFNQGTSLMIF